MQKKKISLTPTPIHILDPACKARQLKTALDNMVPSPLQLCVMDSPALQTQRTVCTVKFVKSFATRQHRFDVDSIFLSYPAPLSLVQFRPKCNQFICWW